MSATEAERLLQNQIEAVLVPIVREMMTDLKGGSSTTAYRDGLERILTWDSKETERVTLHIILSDHPAFFYWVDTLLTLRMRRLYQAYGRHEDCDGTDRCVFIDPYMFVSLMFQSVAKQLLLNSATSPAALDKSDFQKLICLCLQNLLIGVFPFEPMDDWQGIMEKEHQQFWSRYPHMRSYIQYRVRWIDNLRRTRSAGGAIKQQQQASSDGAAELLVVATTLSKSMENLGTVIRAELQATRDAFAFTIAKWGTERARGDTNERHRARSSSVAAQDVTPNAPATAAPAVPAAAPASATTTSTASTAGGFERKEKQRESERQDRKERKRREQQLVADSKAKLSALYGNKSGGATTSRPTGGRKKQEEQPSDEEKDTDADDDSDDQKSEPNRRTSGTDAKWKQKNKRAEVEDDDDDADERSDKESDGDE